MQANDTIGDAEGNDSATPATTAATTTTTTTTTTTATNTANSQAGGSSASAQVAAGAGGSVGNNNNSADQSSEGTGTSDTKIKKGEIDPLGDEIHRVFMHTDLFDIYEAGNKVRYCFRAKNNKQKEMAGRLFPLIDEITAIEDIVAGFEPGKCFDESRRQSEYKGYKERVYYVIARIIAAAFDDEKGDTAQNLLKGLTERVESRRDSKNRMLYIWANLCAFIFFLAVVRILAGTNYFDITNSAVDGARPIDVVTMGILGAFFSVAIGVNDVKVQHSITIREMVYTGFIRIPIGIIAAIVVIVLIEGDWLLGFLDGSEKKWSLYLFGFLAGFSETLIPNALKQIESETKVRTESSVKTTVIERVVPAPAGPGGTGDAAGGDKPASGAGDGKPAAVTPRPNAADEEKPKEGG